ncbi:glutathione S-transferase [Actinobacillus equuli]|nr:glutathione S-transferase [Actinobacillus equuli]
MLNWCRLLGLDFSHLEQLSPFMQRVEANAGVDAVRIAEGLKG